MGGMDRSRVGLLNGGVVPLAKHIQMARSLFFGSGRHGAVSYNPQQEIRRLSSQNHTHS
jgi:hypothetical protein